MRLGWVGSILVSQDEHTDIWWQEMITNQHAQIWHVETRYSQSKIQYPKQYKNATGKRLWNEKDNETP